MTLTYDAIIIGGGIMGCSSALQLARRGMKVVLLEKGTIGAGPTGKSSAVIRQHYSNELTARMALYGLGVFRNFKAEFGDECGFTQTGFVVVAKASDKAGLEANVAFQQSLGIETELLSPESLLELMPGLHTADLVAAAYEPGSGYADPYLTNTAMARAARKEGADIYQDTRVTGISFAGGKVTGVDSNAEKFSAPVVVNCAGSWGAQVAAMAGVSLPINSCRVQVAFFRRPESVRGVTPRVRRFYQCHLFSRRNRQSHISGFD